jgi:hypothetical protein
MLQQVLEKLLVEARQKELKAAIEAAIPQITSDSKYFFLSVELIRVGRFSKVLCWILKPGLSLLILCKS